MSNDITFTVTAHRGSLKFTQNDVPAGAVDALMNTLYREGFHDILYTTQAEQKADEIMENAGEQRAAMCMVVLVVSFVLFALACAFGVWRAV